MRVFAFLVGMVWCALIVNAQEAPPDYYDYYDEAQVEEALAKDPLPSSGDAVPKEKEMAGEEVPLEEAPVTEVPVSTTSEPTTPKAKQRLVKIKPRRISSLRRTLSNGKPRNGSSPEVSTTSPDIQDNKQDSATPRSRGSPRRRGSSRRGNTDAVTTEAPQEESPTSRGNRARNPTLSNRRLTSQSSRRSSNRPSISATTEETNTEAGDHRLKPSRRPSRRGRTESPVSAADAGEEEPQNEPTTSTRRRFGQRRTS